MISSPLQWTVLSNDGTNIVAYNSSTTEKFTGSLADFNAKFLNKNFKENPKISVGNVTPVDPEKNDLWLHNTTWKLFNGTEWTSVGGSGGVTSTEITSIVALTEDQYTALDPKVLTTLYITLPNT
jgi:hypothetical protein